MRYDANDQGGAMNDHQKFGESGTFKAAADDAERTADRAASDVKDSISGAGAAVQDRASQFKTQVADKLESGANTVRTRTADTTGLDNAVSTTKEKLAGVGERLATGMEDTAGWLRGTDMASIQRGLEKQVKESPGRKLLIAAGGG